MQTFLRPISCRTIGILRQAICEGQVAFFLGAGVDRLLWDDSVDKVPGKDPADWIGMLRRLHMEAHSGIASKPTDLDELIQWWPTEVAFLARAHLGNARFASSISESVGDTPSVFAINLQARRTRLLCRSLVRSDLIVTTNYSSHIRRALEEYILKVDDHQNFRLVSLNREDLRGFVFQKTGQQDTSRNTQQRTIYIIHIHGRCSGGSFPILDAWGYNTVQEDDPEYQLFLRDLFTHRHVITIGVGWTDVPLRGAAAYVRRVRPYLQRAHLDLRYYDPTKKILDVKNPGSPVRGWVSAMRSVYGIDVVHTTPKDQEKLLSLLNRRISAPPLDDLERVAEFLDATGDYESGLQASWLASVGPGNVPSTNDRIAHAVHQLYSLLEAAVSNRDLSWEILARIERHLRHQIWLYTEDREERRTRRKKLWELLYTRLNSERDKWSNLAPRVRFDFIVGTSEVHPPRKVNRRNWHIGDPLLSHRAMLGPRIWPEQVRPTPSKIKRQKETVSELLAVGWEAMAAKVLSDRAFGMAQLANGRATSMFTTHDVLDEGFRTAIVAASAGCTRRKVKGDVLTALWSPEPREGRARLLGELQSGGDSFEPGLRSAVVAGLAGCYLRTCNSLDERQLLRELDEVLAESGMQLDELSPGDCEYWAKVAPPALRIGFRILQSQLEERKNHGR